MPDKTFFEKMQEIKPETKEKIAFYGMLGLGVILLFRNHSPKAIQEERKLDTLTDDEISAKVQDILTRNIGSDEGLKQVARKLDKRAAHFDSQSVDRGTNFEMRHIKNSLVAKNTALQHLSEDPNYYNDVDIERAG